MNVVVLQGRLSREPEVRVLPSGQQVAALDVTVREPDRAAESVPVSWLEPRSELASLHRGDEVVVAGRVRRRFFRVGGSTQSRTEVVASSVLRPTQRARVRRLLAAAAGSLGTSA